MRRAMMRAAGAAAALWLAAADAGAQEAAEVLQVEVDLGESVEVVLPTPPYAQLGGADIRVQQWRGGYTTPAASSWRPGEAPEIIVHDWRTADPSRIRVQRWQPFQRPAIRVSGY